MSTPKHHQPYRSFFWPVILLGAGVIWLLTNLGFIPTENLWILFQLWPVLLIMVGLDVIFTRRLPLVGALLALLVLGGVVFILLNGGQLQLAEKTEPRTDTFNVPVENTGSVEFDLNLSTQPAFISVLEDPVLLIAAEIGHLGDVEMVVTGDKLKEIVLEQRGIVSWFAWLLPGAREELTWDIKLNPDVTFDLDVDGGTGTVEMDLIGMQLGRFQFDGGTGASRIVLPASRQGYIALVQAGTGEVGLTLPVEGNLTLRLDGSTGRMILDVPEGAALQVEVLRGGTGDVVAPDWLMKVEGREDRDEGIYQTAGFDEAAFQIMVIVEDLSTGDLVIK